MNGRKGQLQNLGQKPRLDLAFLFIGSGEFDCYLGKVRKTVR